jgi:hypothetical protein
MSAAATASGVWRAYPPNRPQAAQVTQMWRVPFANVCQARRGLEVSPQRRQAGGGVPVAGKPEEAGATCVWTPVWARARLNDDKYELLGCDPGDTARRVIPAGGVVSRVWVWSDK